jgi:hypothetical protein
VTGLGQGTRDGKPNDPCADDDDFDLIHRTHSKLKPGSAAADLRLTVAYGPENPC